MAGKAAITAAGQEVQHTAGRGLYTFTDQRLQQSVAADKALL